jgi:hypothetical protein
LVYRKENRSSREAAIQPSVQDRNPTMYKYKRYLYTPPQIHSDPPSTTPTPATLPTPSTPPSSTSTPHACLAPPPARFQTHKCNLRAGRCSADARWRSWCGLSTLCQEQLGLRLRRRSRGKRLLRRGGWGCVSCDWEDGEGGGLGKREYRILGLRSKALAIARRWRWPPERSMPLAPTRVLKPSGKETWGAFISLEIPGGEAIYGR